MGVSKEVCDTAKEYLTKLAYCQTEESYTFLYQSFQSVVPSSILKYYNDNWHDLRKEWTYMSCASGNFLNMTNNRLECINGKLKTVIKKFSSFSAFVKSLFSIIYSMRKERDHATATAALKVPSVKFPAGSAEELYLQILNPYPFSMLLKQISMSNDPKVTTVKDSEFLYEYQGNSYATSAISCHCLWFNAMKLPCRHILSVRRKLSISIFDQTLCDKRWLKSHLESVHRVFGSSCVDFEKCYTEEEKSNNIPKTTAARYSHLLPLVQKVAAVAAESTGSEFLEKENTLKLLLNFWEKGQKITLSEAAEPVNNVETVLSDHNYGCSAADDHLTSSSAVRDIGTQFEPIPSTSGIKLPAPVKRKGRPAGLTTTVVGLKKKKCNRPVPFTRKTLLERQRMLLRCFVDEEESSKAINKGILIEEDSIECSVEKVSSCCMESCVEINEVKQFFTSDGWLLIQNVISTKSVMMTWECDSCKQDCSHGNTILCDSCLQWYHYSCVGLLQPPKQKYWFCRNCNI